MNRPLRVLWITNTVFPAPSRLLGLPPPISGGWMYGLAASLAESNRVTLAVATVYPGARPTTLDLEGVRYFLLPSRSGARYPRHLERLWPRICEEFEPDLVHVHGTEFLHGLACMRTCTRERFVLSIQGLVEMCGRHYLDGVSEWEALRSVTLRDLVRFDTMFHTRRRFLAHGVFETEYIRRAAHVVGRTEWDRVHTDAVNPGAQYHACNETLRDEFYRTAKWRHEAKVSHSIFLSQGAHPIKGVHVLLEAVALVARRFPDVRVRIAGWNIIDRSSWAAILKQTGYGAFVGRLIERLGLSQQVEFVGPLSAEGMISEYQRAHVFACPSSIENSPNSVGEAQLLGVPTVAAYVGGVPDMVEHGETGLLYRFEDVEMAAERIRQLFSSAELCARLSAGGIRAAELRHDRRRNTQRMLEVYDTVAADEPRAAGSGG